MGNYQLTDQDVATLRAMRSKLANISDLKTLYSSGSGKGSGGEIPFLTVKLTSRDATDKSKYAWQVERRTSSGWETVSGGLTGTLTGHPAYDIDEKGGANFTNLHAVIALFPFKDSSSNNSKAWIIIAVQGSGVQPCRVQQNGGTNGSATANCTYTYDIYKLDNSTKVNTTGGAITPKNPRWPKTPYTAATYGVYFIDNDGSYALFLWDETPGNYSCS